MTFPLRAAKTGMLLSAAHIETTARVLRKYPQLQLVVDPVMIASTGDPLLEPDAIDAYRELLFPLATLITPNLHEAQALLGKTITDESELDAAAIERCGVDPGARPETLTPAQFAALAQALPSS